MITAARLKKCKICKDKFEPFNSMQPTCFTAKCILEHDQNKKKKKIKKDLKDFNLDNKSISKWIAEAQIPVNAYVRLRDHNKPCISCGCLTVKEHLTGSAWHAGHFRSRGSAGHLRFNLHNIQKQCAECNIHQSGSSSNYRINLIYRIGIEKVEALECNNAYRKIDRVYCERIKKIFNKKARMKKKRLGIS